MSDNSNPFLRGAGAWRDQGWLGTLWLPYGKKSPPPTDYTGRLGELEVPDEIVAQWALKPGNLGVRLPQGVVGIDVDWYKPEGQVSYSTLVNECGPLPATYKSSARPTQPHSGVYLYRVDWKIELHDKPLPGIEIIQWFHRYICTWPSVHPDGEMYRLTDPKGMMGVRPPLIDELPFLPEPWLKRLVQIQRPTCINKPLEVTGQWSKAVSALYAETQVALMGAGRHDAMRHGVDGLVRLESQSHPGASEALHLLGAQFTNAITGDGTRTPAEAASELQRLLDGAYGLVNSTASYRPSWDQLERPRSATGTATTPAGPQTWDPIAGWEFADAKDLYAAGLEPIVAEILSRDDGAKLLYRGKVNTIFGMSGSGKTWLAIVAIAQLVAQSQHCLYIDWEDDPRTFYRRLKNLGCSEEMAITYARYISPLAPANPEVIEHLVAQQFALVVMDSTGEAIAAQGGMNQNDDGDVAVWMGALPRPLARAGASVLLVDHMPKAVIDGVRQEIGSQRKRAAVSGASYEVIQTEPFSKNQTGKMIVRTGKDRGGNWARGQVVAECRILPIGDQGDLRVEVGTPIWGGPDGPVRLTGLMEKLSRYIEAHPGVTKSILRSSEVRGRSTAKMTALASLIDEGWASETASGDALEYTILKPYREADDPILRTPDELE